MITETEPRYIAQARAVREMILSAHQKEGGGLDVTSLVVRAVEVRRDVQALEAIVNRGDVPTTLRARLAALQGRDIAHRRTVAEEVPGWAEAVSAAHREAPGIKRAKAMQRAAEALGIWPA